MPHLAKRSSATCGRGLAPGRHRSGAVVCRRRLRCRVALALRPAENFGNRDSRPVEAFARRSAAGGCGGHVRMAGSIRCAQSCRWPCCRRSCSRSKPASTAWAGFGPRWGRPRCRSADPAKLYNINTPEDLNSCAIMNELTHLDDLGAARMVDVGARRRSAAWPVPRASIELSAGTCELIRSDRIAKGSVLAVAQIAGIQAAKRTGELDSALPSPGPRSRGRHARIDRLRHDGAERGLLHRADRRGNGGPHRREHRPAHRLRHVQGGR